MGPAIGFLTWIGVGAVAGLVSSLAISRQLGLSDVVVGVAGAVAGGVVSTWFFSDLLSSSGLWASLVFALGGAGVALFAWKLVKARPA